MLRLQNEPLLEQGVYMQMFNITHKQPYQIFDNVYTNISKTFQKNWLDIYYATTDDEENYHALCVCAILIDKFLRLNCFMTKEDRQVLMGVRLSKIVNSFYRI
jgi:hypothetical protein